MLNAKELRKDFEALNNSKVVYLDNAATMLKPKAVVEAINNYLNNNSANPHADDYDLGMASKRAYEEARKTVADFFHVDKEEIIFTSGATEALNSAASMMSYFVNKGDEVLSSKLEHASNILPWMRLQKEKGIKINYVAIKNGTITLENVKKAVTDKTKVATLTHVSNVLGYENEVKAICEYLHSKGIYVIIDGAQAAPHMNINLHELGCDFYSVSGHKMCGPMGIGVLYIRKELLKKVEPHNVGGGMNARFSSDGVYSYVEPPYCLEAGTPNVVGAVGLASALKYISSIGMDNIREHEYELKKYAVDRLIKEVPGITIYNADSHSGIIAFNLKDIFAQDTATLLNSKGIACRAGHHCAKLLLEELNVPATVRASFAFYNTKEDADAFVEALKKGDEFLDVFFK